NQGVGPVPPPVAPTAPPAPAPPAPVPPEPTNVVGAKHVPETGNPSPPVAPAVVTSTTLGLGAAWSLWNGKSPAIGFVAELEHTWGRFGLRPQLGWSTSINP